MAGNGINGEEKRVMSMVAAWMQEGERVCRVERLLKELECRVNFANTKFAELEAFRRMIVKEDEEGYSCALTSQILSPQARLSLYVKKMSGILNGQIDAVCEEVEAFRVANVKNKKHASSIHKFNRAMDNAKKGARNLASHLNSGYTIDSTSTLEGKEEKKYTMKMEREAKKLSDEKEAVKQQNKTLTEEKKDLTEKNQALRDEINKWNANLISVISQNTTLTDEKNILQQTNQSLTEQNQALVDEINKWHANHRRVCSELDDVSASFNNKSRSLDAANIDLEAMRFKLFGALSIDDSPLQRMVQMLPDSWQAILAPKGAITGEEFGFMMGTLVAITAEIVTYSNAEIAITAPGAALTLMGMVLGMVANNIVVHLSTAREEEAGFFQTLGKGMGIIPWIILGGILPLAIGGFITHWKLRALVTGLVMLIMKLLFGYLWVRSYNIPGNRVWMIVGMGVIGVGLSAAAPSLLGWTVNIVKKHSAKLLEKKMVKGTIANMAEKKAKMVKGLKAIIKP